MERAINNIPGTNFIKNHPISLFVSVVSILILLLVFGQINSLYTEGVNQETRLGAQYLDNQNYLSAYISGFHEQIGVGNTATAALDQVITDAVKGRYDENGFAVNSPFFAAIVEAYPDKSATELVALWGRINDYVIAQREGYRNQQSKLLDMLRSYDTWRQSGIIQSTLIRIIGYPSDRLVARVGENKYIGQVALDRMYRIVLTQDALDAYNNGVLAPLQP